MTTRTTPQRVLLLGLLREMKTHPTAEQLFTAARQRMPRISRGTVYRNLDILIDQQQVRRIDHEVGPTRYDARTDAHDHVVCAECGAMTDVEPANIQLARADAARATGYQLLSHDLIFSGLCPVCQVAAGQQAALATP